MFIYKWYLLEALGRSAKDKDGQDWLPGIVESRLILDMMFFLTGPCYPTAQRGGCWYGDSK